MSREKGKKKKGLSLTGLTALLVLCVIMILLDLYLFMRSSLSSSSTADEAETQTQSDTSPAVSSLPQIIQVEQPDVQLTGETAEAADETEQTESAAASDGSWQNGTLSFQYDTDSMWVSESGGVISITDLTGSTLPRADIQVLSNAEDLTEEEFSSLAGAAVRAYFSFEPAEDAVVLTGCSVAGGVYEAELTVAATDVSPALLAWVRLEDGILTSMLLEADAGSDTVTLWQALLQSVEPL